MLLIFLALTLSFHVTGNHACIPTVDPEGKRAQDLIDNSLV